MYKPRLLKRPPSGVAGACQRFEWCQVLFQVMDDRWVERLVDSHSPLGSCFLQEYARAMRLISGLCRKGFLRCLAQARFTRFDTETRCSLMAHPSVQEFTRFLREFPSDQAPMVWEVLTSSLFPDHAGGSLFRAGAIDPLRFPFQALEAAVQDLRNAEAVLPALSPRCPETPAEWESGEWDPTAYTEVTTGIGRDMVDEDSRTFPDEFFLPSTIAGFGGPGASAMLHPDEPFVQVLHPSMPTARMRERKRRRREPRDQMEPCPMATTEGMSEPVSAPAETVAVDAPPAETEQEFEEIVDESLVPEPIVPPRPRDAVPEPKHPPRHKSQVVQDERDGQPQEGVHETKRIRKSRWDPEERPTTIASGDMFQFGFVPTAGLPTIAIPTITKLVASIQVVLRASPRVSVDVVVTKDDLDPFLQSKASDFGQVLKHYALHSRLSLLSYGRAWKLKFIDHEVSSTVVTLFLHAELISQVPLNSGEPQSKKAGRPPRSRSPRRKPGSGSKPSGSGPSGSRDDGTTPARPVFSSGSHGSTRPADEGSSFGTPLALAAATVLTVDTTHEDVVSTSTSVSNEDAVNQRAAEISPTIPFQVQEASVPTVAPTTAAPASTATAQDVTFSNWYHFPKDGRRHCNADWVQVQAPAVQAVLRGGEVRGILEAIQDLPFHPLGGFHGCTVVGPNCRVQLGTQALAPEAVSARAYKVSPSCLYCQETILLDVQVFECPKCLGDLGSFRLPNQHFSQLRGTQEIVDQIRPHHVELGTRSGLFNLSFKIQQIFKGHWLVRGPDDVEFYVLLPRDVESLVDPAIDQPYYLYQAPCVGLIEGKFILRAPSPRETGALIRQHTSQDSPRVLELFSGIGGWHQALQAVFSQEVPVTSVEIDPIPARTLARSTGRPCLTPQEWLTTPLLQDFVLNADIKDPTWWASTLVHPFSQVCFSAPCVPWSTAGCRRGLHDDDGLLLIHVAVLLVLFQVDLAVGENVPGLLSHPHWQQVQQVFESTGLQFDSRIHDLAQFGIMQRKRSFLTLTRSPVIWPDVHTTSDQDFTSVFLDRLDRSRTQVPLSSVPMLSQRKLLPSNLLQKAYERGLEDGESILNLRVHQDGPLPTLVASYRVQTRLSFSHLQDRGLYTWLVDPVSPRFLDPFEGARALGFSPGLQLPQDLDAAMKCVGNSLSPIQALVVLFAVLPEEQKVSFEVFQNIVNIWVQGFRPMTDFRVLTCGEFSQLVLRSFLRPHVIDRFHVSMGSCDGQVFPLNLAASISKDDCSNAQAWPLGPPWTIHEVGRHFTEDTLLLVFRVAAARLNFSRMGVPKCCLLSPFTRLRQVTEVLKIPHLLLRDVDLPLWMTMVTSELDCGDASLTLRWDDDEVFFAAGQDVRVWRYAAGTPFHQVADLLFPNCSTNGVHVQQADNLEFVDKNLCPVPGRSYRFHFQPIRVRVEPFGFFAIDPLSSVDQLAQIVNFQQYRGKASVHICVDGRLAPKEVSAALATQLGVLRARVYALPGGAWTLNTVQEELQTLLVQHGHPASDVDEKANLLIDKFGAKQCKAWLDTKHPWATFKAEASKAKIVLIPQEARGLAKSSQALPDLQDDPWKNWNRIPEEKPTGPRRRKPDKKQTLQSRIDYTFFHIGGSEVQPLELHQLLQGSPGLHVTTLHDFQQHLDTVLAANVCLGAAGVLLVGSSANDVATTTSGRIQDVIVPGWLGSHAAALKAALIQVGDSPIEAHSIKSLTVQQVQSPHQVVQFHVCRNECDKWDLLVTEGFESFLKQLGFVHLSAVNQMWACDFYSRGKRASPDQAVYYHGFVKLDQNKVDPLLKMGGMSGFYPSPRSATRGADPRFRSILMRGLSLPEARKYQASVSTALGLTRTRQGLGLRVPATEYSAVKKKLFPQALESSEIPTLGYSKRHDQVWCQTCSQSTWLAGPCFKGFWISGMGGLLFGPSTYTFLPIARSDRRYYGTSLTEP